VVQTGTVFRTLGHGLLTWVCVSTLTSTSRRLDRSNAPCNSSHSTRPPPLSPVTSRARSDGTISSADTIESEVLYDMRLRLNWSASMRTPLL
jgi:hypothetical protein